MLKAFYTLFDIRQDEVNKTLLMFSYIFLIIASLLIAKPVRNSLFLTHYGAQMLPYAFVLVAVFAAFIITIYTRLSKKFQFNKLITATLLISIISLIFFWILLIINYNRGWFFFVIYIWVALFGVITTSQFWLLANYVFNARQAKRLFGFIGSGAISGGIAGGYMTRLLAPILGTANMLLICILFLILCIILVRFIWQKDTKQNYTKKLLKEEKQRRGEKSSNAIKIISKSKHLTYLALIVGVGVIVANLVDFQFNAIASDIIKDKDDLTAFFGFWLSNLSIASLIIQMFLTGRIFKYFGVSTSLYFLPIGILIGAFGILLQPALWSAIFIKVADGGFKQSINKAGLELLTVPIPSKMKNQTKAFIDVFIDSLATGIGGLLLILLTTQFQLSVSQISYIVIMIIIVWVFLIIKVKSEYINSFRQAIEKRSIDLSQQTTNVDDATLLSFFAQTLASNNVRQLEYVLNLFENISSPQLVPYLQNLLLHKSHQIRLQTLKNIRNYDPEDFIDSVKELINDKHFDNKVEAILFLLQNEKESDSLLKSLLSNSDYKICCAALLATSIQFKQDTSFAKKINIFELFQDFLKIPCIQELNPKQMIFVKITISKVIGISKIKELYPYMLELLNNESISVVQSAIIQSGETRDPIFIPYLIEYLKDVNFKSFARTALANSGDVILPEMDRILNNKNSDIRLLYALPKVLSLVNSQESANILLIHLNTEKVGLRYRIIKALNKQRSGNPILKFDIDKVENNIFLETENYYKLLTVHNIFMDKDKRYMNNKEIISLELLIRSIQERIDETLEKIFRLLGLMYSPGDIYNAYIAITSQQADSNANAIEFLDNLLHSKLKKLILPLVEENNQGQETKSSSINSNYLINDEKEALQVILEDNDSWLKSCVIYYMAEHKITVHKSIIDKLNNNSDPVVKETITLYKSVVN